MFEICKNRKIKLPIIIISIIAMLLVSVFELKASIDVVAATSFEKTLELFPESYRDSLKALHDAHPNWSFVPFYTEMTWSEALGSNAEMQLSRNLVPNVTMGINGKWFSTPSSWKDTAISGSFNWKENAWVIFDGGSGGWVQASQTAVEYVMDPRNWLTEENIFEFEMLSFNSEYQTKDLLKKMMDDTFMDCDYAKVGGSGSKTYAEVLMEAGEKYNVSPVHLCARLIQEKGRGTYNSTTNKYELKDTLATGVKGTDGITYYNFFNIGASGATQEAIIKNGTAEAQAAGWTSQYKAIMGGASKVAGNYIDIGQDTIYFQKFSVVDPKYYYWKQYMQNLLAPVNEGYNTRNAYKNSGLLDSSFVFKIPVYKEMPEEKCPEPSGDGNPNYKLSSLSVTGTYMDGSSEKLVLSPTFNTDKLTYNIVVPYKMTSVKISAAAYAADTSKISGTGTYDLSVGTNTFTVTCKAENGKTRKYKVNIERPEGSTYMTTLSASTGVFNKTFTPEKQSYNLYVSNDTDTVTFDYITESSIAEVILQNGSTSEVCKDGKAVITGLKEGKNTIYLDVCPSSGATSEARRYTFNIVRYSGTTYNLSGYQIEGSLDDFAAKTKYINGFNIGNTVADVKKTVAIQNGRMTILNSSNTEKTDSELIGTGDIIEIYDENGYIMYKFKVILYGDVNGDGKVDLYDFAYMKKQILKNTGLSGVYLKASDIYPETEGLDLYDIAVIKKHILKNGEIIQTR